MFFLCPVQWGGIGIEAPSGGHGTGGRGAFPAACRNGIATFAYRWVGSGAGRCLDGHGAGQLQSLHAGRYTISPVAQFPGGFHLRQGGNGFRHSGRDIGDAHFQANRQPRQRQRLPAIPAAAQRSVAGRGITPVALVDRRYPPFLCALYRPRRLSGILVRPQALALDHCHRVDLPAGLCSIDRDL